jgi:hypothetical protein
MGDTAVSEERETLVNSDERSEQRPIVTRRRILAMVPIGVAAAALSMTGPARADSVVVECAADLVAR